MLDKESESIALVPGAMDRRTDLVLALAVSLLGLLLLVITETTIREDVVGDIIGPRAVPQVLSAFLVIGGLSVAIRNFIALRQGNSTGDEGIPDDEGIPASAKRAFIVMGLSLGYAALFVPLGFVIATPLYLVTAFWATEARSKIALILLPVVFTASLFLLFAVFFHVRLPGGIATEVLRVLGVTR